MYIFVLLCIKCISFYLCVQFLFLYTVFNKHCTILFVLKFLFIAFVFVLHCVFCFTLCRLKCIRISLKFIWIFSDWLSFYDTCKRGSLFYILLYGFKFLGLLLCGSIEVDQLGQKSNICYLLYGCSFSSILMQKCFEIGHCVLKIWSFH